MNKPFWILVLFVFLLPVNALPACFEQVGTTFTTTDPNPYFAIGIDGKFYAAASSSDLIDFFHSQDGATWAQSSISGKSISSFETHPDPSKATTVFISGKLAPGGQLGQDAFAVSTNGGQSWNQVARQTSITGATQLNAQSSKEILVIDKLNASNIYKLNPSGSSLELFASTQLTPLFQNISSAGNYVYPISFSSPLRSYFYRFDSATQQLSGGQDVWDVTAFTGTSDGYIFYANRSYGSAVVVGYAPSSPDIFVGKFTNARVDGLAKYNENLVILTNHVNPGKAFALWNGSVVTYLELNSTSPTADFIPTRARVRPTDNKLYLLGKSTAHTWGVYLLKPECIVTTPVVTNTVPVVVASVVNATVLVNSGATLVASATDAEGDVLSFNWTQLSGDVLNMSLWNYSVDNASVSIYFEQIGVYSFEVNVTDSGSPNMVGSAVVSLEVVEPAPVVPSCADDLECSAAEYCSENNACSAIPIALRCASSDACAPNQECLNARRCVELSCEASEVIVDHACLAPGQFTACGGQSFTGVGSCCSEQWIVGALQCPGVTPPVNNGSLNGSNGTRSGGNATGGDLFASIFQAAGSLGAIGLVVAGVLVLALLLVIFLVVFRKKKPPVDELMASEPSDAEEPQSK